MTDNQQEPQAKRQKLPERDVQSMGWLTESTMQPRKHRFVEGDRLAVGCEHVVLERYDCLLRTLARCGAQVLVREASQRCMRSCTSWSRKQP